MRVDGDEKPGTCQACGNYVDGAGEAVGGVRTTVVLEGLKLERSRRWPRGFFSERSAD